MRLHRRWGKWHDIDACGSGTLTRYSVCGWRSKALRAFAGSAGPAVRLSSVAGRRIATGRYGARVSQPHDRILSRGRLVLADAGNVRRIRTRKDSGTKSARQTIRRTEGPGER